jgi:hypothetical protein
MHESGSVKFLSTKSDAPARRPGGYPTAVTMKVGSTSGERQKIIIGSTMICRHNLVSATISRPVDDEQCIDPHVPLSKLPSSSEADDGLDGFGIAATLRQAIAGLSEKG